MSVTSGFYCICKDVFVFSFMKLSTFLFSYTAFIVFYIFWHLFFRKVIFSNASARCRRLIVTFVFYRFFHKLLNLLRFFFIVFLHNQRKCLYATRFLVFSIDICLYMGRSNKNLRCIAQLKIHVFCQCFREYLFKKNGVIKTAGIVFAKSRKVRNRI